METLSQFTEEDESNDFTSSQCEDSDNTWQNSATSCSCVHVHVCVGFFWGEGFKYQSLTCWFYYLPEEQELLAPLLCVLEAGCSIKT